MLGRTTIHAAVAVLAIFFSTALNNRALAAFVNGDFITYPQEAWDTSASEFFFANYGTVYAPTFSVEVGIAGSAPQELSIRFTNSVAVLTYLPSIGPDWLVADALNPNESEVAGTLGGDILALQLDVDFSDAGITPAGFGELVLHDYPSLTDLNDMSIREILAHGNIVLGSGYNYDGFYRDKISALADELTNAFDSGTVSQFAQDHLRLPVDMRGDFNQDGTVDAADYVVWRKSLQGLRQTAELYDHWRATFGNTTLSSAAQAAVP